MDNSQDKEPWRKYFTACHSEEVTIMWQSGQAIREWAAHGIRTREEMEAEGQRIDVSLGDIADACLEGQMEDEP